MIADCQNKTWAVYFMIYYQEYWNVVRVKFLKNSPRARGVLFVLRGPYNLRVPPIVKFSQESESARLTKIILSKSTVKTL